MVELIIREGEMVNALVSTVGLEEMSVYTKSVSEFGKVTMIAGVIGVVASPIIGSSWGLGVGMAALGYGIWNLFDQVSKDFHAAGIIVKMSLAARQEWQHQQDLKAARFSQIK